MRTNNKTRRRKRRTGGLLATTATTALLMISSSLLLSGGGSNNSNNNNNNVLMVAEAARSLPEGNFLSAEAQVDTDENKDRRQLLFFEEEEEEEEEEEIDFERRTGRSLLRRGKKGNPATKMRMLGATYARSRHKGKSVAKKGKEEKAAARQETHAKDPDNAKEAMKKERPKRRNAIVGWPEMKEGEQPSALESGKQKLKNAMEKLKKEREEQPEDDDDDDALELGGCCGK